MYPGCIYLEIAHAVSLLTGKATLIVATPDGCSVQVGEGWSVEANVSFSAAPAEKAKSVLIPGGDIYEVKDNAALDQLLVTADKNGAVIGGICERSTFERISESTNDSC